MEKLVDPYSLMLRSEERAIAQELFKMEHKEFAKAGENWMKTTSEFLHDCFGFSHDGYVCSCIYGTGGKQ